jgi:hypothetical protein
MFFMKESAHRSNSYVYGYCGHDRECNIMNERKIAIYDATNRACPTNTTRDNDPNDPVTCTCCVVRFERTSAL